MEIAERGEEDEGGPWNVLSRGRGRDGRFVKKEICCEEGRGRVTGFLRACCVVNRRAIVFRERNKLVFV